MSENGGDRSSDGLSRRTVAAFAAGVGPVAILGLPLSVYLPPFISEGGVIPVALVGLLFSLSAFWDGIVDPLLGGMIDRRSRGAAPHRGWMARAAFPLAVLTILLVSLGDSIDFWLLLPLLLLFYSAYSLFEVAHLAWGSSLSSGNPESSARLFGAREYAAKFVLLFAFATPAVAQLIMPDISLQGRIIAYVALVALALPLALYANRHVPPRAVIVEPGLGWRREWRLSLRSPALLLVMAVHFLNAFAFGAMASTYVFFAEAYLRLDRYGSLLLFLTFVGGALTTPFWTGLARRLGKPGGMITMCLFLIALLAIGQTLPLRGQLLPASLYTVALGGGFMGLLFIYGMIADYAPHDARICGRDRTAFIFALGNLMQKFGNAAALALSYWLLDLGGFDPERAHDHGTLVRNVWAGLPIAAWGMAAIALLFLRRQPWTGGPKAAMSLASTPNRG